MENRAIPQTTDKHIWFVGDPHTGKSALITQLLHQDRKDLYVSPLPYLSKNVAQGVDLALYTAPNDQDYYFWNAHAQHPWEAAFNKKAMSADCFAIAIACPKELQMVEDDLKQVTVWISTLKAMLAERYRHPAMVLILTKTDTTYLTHEELDSLNERLALFAAQYNLFSAATSALTRQGVDSVLPTINAAIGRRTLILDLEAYYQAKSGWHLSLFDSLYDRQLKLNSVERLLTHLIHTPLLPFTWRAGDLDRLGEGDLKTLISTHLADFPLLLQEVIQPALFPTREETLPPSTQATFA